MTASSRDHLLPEQDQLLRLELLRMAAAEQPLSVRALYYRAVLNPALPFLTKDKGNDRRNERLVQSRCLALRRAGEMPWSWIVDPSRARYEVDRWAGPAAFADAQGSVCLYEVSAMHLSWIRPLSTDSLPLIRTDRVGNIWALSPTNYGPTFGDYLGTSPILSVFHGDGSPISVNTFTDSLSPRWRTDGWGGYQYFIPQAFALDDAYGWKIAGVGGISHNHTVPPFMAYANKAGESPEVAFLPEQYLIIKETAIDSNGDQFIVGSYQAGWEDPLGALSAWGTRTPGYVSKVSNNGSPTWMVLLGDKQEQRSVVSSIVVDKDGSVFVGGYSGSYEQAATRVNQYDFASVESPNAFLAKLSSEGGSLWQVSIGDIGEHEYITDLAVDTDGSIFLAGIKRVEGSLYSTSESQSFISKYNTSGGLVWSRSMGDVRTKLHAIALDGFGNVFVGGETYEELGASRGSWDAFVTSFDVNGTQGELLSFGSTAQGNGHDVVTGLALDPEGEHLYISGTSQNIVSWVSSLQGEAARWIDLSDWDAREIWGDGFIGRISLKYRGEPPLDQAEQKEYVANGSGMRIVASADQMDRITFAPASFKSASPDVITGFLPTEDKIVLPTAVFAKLKSTKMTTISSKKQLKKSKSGLNSAQLVYNQLTGEVIYDENGKKKGFGSGGVFARFEGETLPILTANNFELG